MKLLVNFYANVSDQTVNDFIKLVTQILTQQSQQGNNIDEIIIQISSSGGSSDHGLLAYNFLKQIGVNITTIGMSNVDSAAIMIYCAGNKRLSVPSCRFLIHEATATIQGIFNANKLKEWVDITKRVNDDYCTVISKVCDLNLPKVRSVIKQSKVMSSEQAKEFGLVKEIIKDSYINIKDLNGPIIGINNPQKITQSQQKAEV